jgi:hypothetical protein
VPSFATELAQLLNGVRRPGDFCAVGTCEVFAPGLEVEGIGPIALPLLPTQAEQLIAVAKRAPFGRGEQTLVDTDVRRTWQIDAGRVRIHGQGWARSLAGFVERAARGLGVTGPVAAELYKLLVLLREPPRYREDGWDVRDPGRRASYEKRAAQRKNDFEVLTRIEDRT